MSARPMPTGRARIGRQIRAFAHGGKVRLLAVVAPGPAEEAAIRHDLRSGAIRLSAEGLVASALLASQIKGEERLTVQIQAERPVFSFMAEVREGGLIRARFTPEIMGPTDDFRGMMLSIKTLGSKELYRGITPIQDQGMGEALEHSLRESSQLRARVRIGSAIDSHGKVTFAAGLLLEAMPDTSEEDFEQWVDGVLANPLVELCNELAFARFGGEQIELLEALDLQYQCTCSKERVERTLRALGADDLEDLLAEQGQAEASCHFCNERYVLDATELRLVIAELRGTIGEA